jgi:hypothetical protein
LIQRRRLLPWHLELRVIAVPWLSTSQSSTRTTMLGHLGCRASALMSWWLISRLRWRRA